MKHKLRVWSLMCLIVATLSGRSTFGHDISWNKATITVENGLLKVSIRLVQSDLLGAVQPGTDSMRIRSKSEWEALLPHIRSYVFSNTHLLVDGSAVTDIVNDSWSVEATPTGKISGDGIPSDTVTMGVLTLSRSWKTGSSPLVLTWRSDILENVDVPVKWVVLISTTQSSDKRMYAIASRGETASYNFENRSWKSDDRLDIPTGNEATLWGKLKQMITVGFGKINLERIFASSGEPKVIVLYLLVAILIGAFHALSPGHGKALIGAYIIGSRGTVSDAVTLGIITAISHTISVLILGIVLMLVFDTVIPQEVTVYINVIAGTIITLIGVYLIIVRLEGLNASHTHDHEHPHAHPHNHVHSGQALHYTNHHHPHEHSDHSHSHLHGSDHSHHHISMESIQMKNFWTNVITGVSGGMVPCPTALAVLFLAISLRKLALGILLILFFSLGLAATLTAIAILFTNGSTLVTKWDSHYLMYRLPAFSAVVVILIGLIVIIRSVALL